MLAIGKTVDTHVQVKKKEKSIFLSLLWEADMSIQCWRLHCLSLSIWQWVTSVLLIFLQQRMDIFVQQICNTEFGFLIRHCSRRQHFVRCINCCQKIGYKCYKCLHQILLNDSTLRAQCNEHVACAHQSLLPSSRKYWLVGKWQVLWCYGPMALDLGSHPLLAQGRKNSKKALSKSCHRRCDLYLLYSMHIGRTKLINCNWKCTIYTSVSDLHISDMIMLYVYRNVLISNESLGILSFLRGS